MKTILPSKEMIGLARQVVDKGGLFSMRATGDSMFPAVCDGDMVVVGPVGPDGPQPGEIVLAETQSGIKLHRLIDVLNDNKGLRYLIKGDAEYGPGEEIDANSLCGLVAKISRPFTRSLSPRFIVACFKTILIRRIRDIYSRLLDL